MRKLDDHSKSSSSSSASASASSSSSPKTSLDSTWAPGPGRMLEVLLTSAHRVSVEMQSDLLGEMSTLQLVAIRMLARAAEPMLARDLAVALGCTPSATTQLVNRLVRDGHVVQEEDPADRRCKRLSVTDGGREAVLAAQGALDRCIGMFMRTFSSDERDALLALLIRLEENAAVGRAVRAVWDAKYPGRPPRRQGREA